MLFTFFIFIAGWFIWLLFVATHFVRYKTVQLRSFRFSIWNYHILVLPSFFAILGLSYVQGSVYPFVMFVIFSFVGVLAEVLISVWWHALFGQRLWIYSAKTLFHRYTSLLNFIPWGAAGLLYISIVSDLGKRAPAIADLGTPAALFIVSLVVQLIIFFALVAPHLKGGKFHTASLANYLFFLLPILITIAYLIAKYGTIMAWIGLAFALAATSAEYIFGKISQFFITKKLWTYTYESFDNGHFTPLSILLFMFAGFYFWFIALYISRVFPYL